MKQLLQRIRGQVIINLVHPFTTVRLDYIANVRGRVVPWREREGPTRQQTPLTHAHAAQEIRTTEAEAEELVTGLVLDGKLDAQIDQVANVLNMRSACVACTPLSPTLASAPDPGGWRLAAAARRAARSSKRCRSGATA